MGFFRTVKQKSLTLKKAFRDYFGVIKGDQDKPFTPHISRKICGELEGTSAIRPIPHGPDFPVPEPDGNMEYSSDSKHNDMTVVAGDGTYKPEEDNQPVPLTQAELNNLTRDLNLSKKSAGFISQR